MLSIYKHKKTKATDHDINLVEVLTCPEIFKLSNLINQW